MAARDKPRGAKAKSRRDRLHKAAMGRKKAALNDPARITQPLTPKTLGREQESATRLKFGDEERAIQGEQRASDLQSSRIGGWFDEYQAKVREGQQRTQAAYQQAQTATQQGTAQQMHADTERWQHLRAVEGADAGARGAAPDTEASQRSAQAITARGTTSDIAGAQMASQGANQAAYMIDRERIGARSGIEERLKEGGRRRTLDQTFRDVQKKKGDFKSEYGATRRGEERKYQLESKAFNLEASSTALKLQEDVNTRKQAAADRKAERRSRELIAKGSQRTSRENAELAANTSRSNNERTTSTSASNNERTTSTSASNSQRSAASRGGKSGGLTPTQKRANQSKFDKGVNIANQLKRAGKITPGKGQAGIDFLVSKGIPVKIAQRAVETAIYSGSNPNKARHAQKTLGIRVPALKNVPMQLR